MTAGCVRFFGAPCIIATIEFLKPNRGGLRSEFQITAVSRVISGAFTSLKLVYQKKNIFVLGQISNRYLFNQHDDSLLAQTSLMDMVSYY